MANDDSKGKYDDIIDLPHHVSANRPRMSMIDRAAQFSSFAALTGYEEAVEETARLTENKLELTEESKLMISDKLQCMCANICSHPCVTITYFVPDTKKDGGAYVTVTGTVKRIDEYDRYVVLCDKTKIQIDQIWNIKIE